MADLACGSSRDKVEWDEEQQEIAKVRAAAMSFASRV